MTEHAPNAPATGPAEAPAPAPRLPAKPAATLPQEFGGAKGPEPTRYGDWEHKGRCTDF